MGSELTTTNQEVGLSVPPAMVLGNAQIAAKALGEVLKNKPKPVIINKEQYLEYEDWQTLGQFYGYTVKTGAAEMVDIDGVKGAKASASLIDIHTGLFLGGAEAYCMRDEEKWGTRAKYEWQGSGNSSHRVKIGEESVPWFQLASMAQTRAGAKAFRNRLAWVVVMAGFKATPAEEIQGEHQTTTGQKQRAQPEQALSGGISAPQNRKVQATCTEMKIDKDSYHAYLTAVFGRAHTNELTKKEASEVIEAVSEGQDRIDAELAKMMEE